MLNLHELAVFLAAVEEGNFSEAGRRMHLSQPAVSQVIQSLERQFGVRLFERSGRTARLSEAGQALAPMARELLAGANRLEENMSSLHGAVAGEMTLGCSTASGKYLLPPLIARFRRIFPQVRVNVHVTSRDGVMRALLAGDLAMGVSSKQFDHHNLESRHVFTDEISLIVSSQHRWARFRRVRSDDLLDEPIILREDAAGTRAVVGEALLARGISTDMLNVGMVLGNAEAIVMAVEEGLGVAFVSRLSSARSRILCRVVEVEVEGMVLSRPIYLARNLRFPATRAQAELWNFANEPNLLPSIVTSLLGQ